MQHIQVFSSIYSVLGKEMRTVDIAPWHYTVNVHFRLQGQVNFGTHTPQIMRIAISGIQFVNYDEFVGFHANSSG
jgi:hypothetical protein